MGPRNPPTAPPRPNNPAWAAGTAKTPSSASSVFRYGIMRFGTLPSGGQYLTARPTSVSTSGFCSSPAIASMQASLPIGRQRTERWPAASNVDADIVLHKQAHRQHHDCRETTAERHAGENQPHHQRDNLDDGKDDDTDQGLSHRPSCLVLAVPAQCERRERRGDHR